MILSAALAVVIRPSRENWFRTSRDSPCWLTEIFNGVKQKKNFLRYITLKNVNPRAENFANDRKILIATPQPNARVLL
jgi:hypothetical protein